MGVSNAILDKPGKPNDEEFAEIRKNAEYSQRILEQISAFRRLADVAGAHHGDSTAADTIEAWLAAKSPGKRAC